MSYFDEKISSIRAILVEDDNELRESLIQTLSELGVETIGADRAADFYQKLFVGKFDVAIIDIGLPDGDGLSIVRFLSERTEIGLIILTVAGEDEDRIRGFVSGADLYFVKPVNCQELAAAAARLTQRRRLAQVDPVALPWIMRRKEWQLKAPSGIVVTLTTREMEFLHCLGTKSGEAVSRTDLLAHLKYGQDTTDSRSLDALVRRLRIKSEPLLGHPLPVRTIYGFGYLFSEPLIIE